MNKKQLKAHLQAELDKVIFSTNFKQDWIKQYPEKADESVRMRLHFLDGKREVLEELLKAVA